jgi:hypothetical protein
VPAVAQRLRFQVPDIEVRPPIQHAVGKPSVYGDPARCRTVRCSPAFEVDCGLFPSSGQVTLLGGDGSPDGFDQRSSSARRLREVNAVITNAHGQRRWVRRCSLEVDCVSTNDTWAPLTRPPRRARRPIRGNGEVQGRANNGPFPPVNAGAPRDRPRTQLRAPATGSQSGSQADVSVYVR